MWPTHYIPYVRKVDGIPPPRYYLTTTPYPIETTESLTSSFGNVDGAFGIGDDSELKSSASFVSGELVTRLKTTDAGRDELKSSASFVSGSMATTGFKQGYDTEQLKSSASFVSGLLDEILIQYTNWPLRVDQEDLASSGSFVSGTLT